MKRFLSLLLATCLFGMLLSIPVFAVDNSRSYEFSLSSNNSNEIQAVPGDIITITLTLTRTSGSGPMYAMQDEINYDSSFFEFVEGSDMVYTDVETTDIELKGNIRAHYLNFLSLNGGADWDETVTVGTFQLRVIADSGVSMITNQECKVSTYDGSDTYAITVNDLRVIVSTDCIVRFESNGGTAVEDQIIQYGELLEEPEDPIREGHSFTGWYKDIGRTQLWDFEKDVVEGNMTLYAGWEKLSGTIDTEDSDDCIFPWWILLVVLGGVIILVILLLIASRKRVTFETGCRTRIKPVYVKRGGKIEKPVNPRRHSADFMGWTTEPNGIILWDFENDTVEKNITLYAKWR